MKPSKPAPRPCYEPPARNGAYLAWLDGEWRVVKWRRGQWLFDGLVCEPTWWLELPEKPQ